MNNNLTAHFGWMTGLFAPVCATLKLVSCFHILSKIYRGERVFLLVSRWRMNLGSKILSQYGHEAIKVSMSTYKGASRTFKGSPKLFEFILWEPGMLIPNVVPVQPVHVEIFYWISRNFELLVALKETSKHCQSHWDSSFVGTINICSTFPDSPSNCCWDISLSARHVSGARGKNRGSPQPAGFIPWERQTSAPNFTAMPPIFVEIFQEQSCALTDIFIPRTMPRE